MQTEALKVLLLIEARDRSKEVYDRIKLAIVAHSPERAPNVFPELFPEVRQQMIAQSQQEAVEAINSDDPIEVISSVEPSEALDLLGQLDAAALGIG